MNILITIGLFIVAVWLALFVLHILGALVHILLLVALIVMIYGFLRRKTSI